MQRFFATTKAIPQPGHRARPSGAWVAGALLFLAAAVTALPGHAQDAPAAAPPVTAQLVTADGTAMGMVSVADTASGMALVTLNLSGVPEGVHGAHIHETGTCDGPDFKSAGGHLAGGRAHGVMDAQGPHQGDLPNVHAPATGTVMVEYFVPNLPADVLTDADGAAFILHAGADDYAGQPAGNAGDRLACGVFAPAG
ncbi:superoxide dismutase family protein [Paracoccus pacificus]|uniref:Superoxide dismutase family protein n=1 Tax=Paracoccus pacificus TaxID=1463598 RepID=A0ABW4R997_9RHOB